MNRKLGVVLIIIGILMLAMVGVKWIWNGSVADLADVSVNSGEVLAEDTQTFDPAAIKKVVVRNPVGTVNVRGDRNAKEATVTVTKRLVAKWGFGSNEEAANRVQVNIGAKGDREMIEVLQGGGGVLKKQVFVVLDITLPSGTELDIENSVGLVDVKGMETSVRAVADVGTITINGFREAVDASVTTGLISIRGGQAVTSMVAENTTGEIEVAIPRDAKLRVEARTDTGGITSEFPELQSQIEQEIPGARLNGRIGDSSAGGVGMVDLSTATGSIRILSE